MHRNYVISTVAGHEAQNPEKKEMRKDGKRKDKEMGEDTRSKDIWQQEAESCGNRYGTMGLK